MTGSNFKTLVIDNNPEIISSIDAALTKEGFDVISSSDSAEAIKLAIEVVPHLVLVREYLPGARLLILKAPSRSVLLPIVVPLITTVEPGSVSAVFSSITFPFMLEFWENTTFVKTTITNVIKNFNFIVNHFIRLQSNCLQIKIELIQN